MRGNENIFSTMQLMEVGGYKNRGGLGSLQARPQSVPGGAARCANVGETLETPEISEQGGRRRIDEGIGTE